MSIPLPPPDNYVSAILGGKVMIKRPTPEVARLLQARGGTEEQIQGEAVWTVDLPDDQALAKLLAELRDRAAVFAGGPAGWPPAEIFDDLRSRGLLSGSFQEILWRGAGTWSTRTR